MTRRRLSGTIESMKSTASRFPRTAAWRRVNEIVRLAKSLDPGQLTYEQSLTMSTRQMVRHIERNNDLVEIAHRAQLLRDAIGALR